MLYEWIRMKRGDQIPKNAVYAGQTDADSIVYIGKMDNSPGKVNLKNGTIYNFWSQNYNSREEGELLINHGISKWVELKYGEDIPENAVFGGRDFNRDKVWVGKDVTTDEPGKITVHDSNNSTPQMCRLWCHSYWRTADVKIAYVLVIEPKPVPVIQTIPQPVLQVEEEEWGDLLQYNKHEEHIKSQELNVSVNNIVTGITKTIALASGDLTHFSELLKIDIDANIKNSVIDCEDANISMVNDEKKTYYIILKYYKKTRESQRGITLKYQLFRYNNVQYDFIVEYAIIKPDNELSYKRCEEFKRKLINKILRKIAN